MILTILTLILLGYFLQEELRITEGVLGVPLDDAWIHFQFARNLSQGHGFSYNPGEPTPGSTAPLWTILLAGVSILSSDILRPAIALSAIFFLLSIWLTFGFTYWISRSYWPAFLAALGTILVGRFLWAGMAAMETTAFAALSLAAIWIYSKHGLRLLPALLFALASQFRPEGHALFALAIVDSGYQWWQDQRGFSEGRLNSLILQFLPVVAVYILIAAPYSIFSLISTGRPLPNTFYAKVGSQNFISMRTFQETVLWHWQDNPFSLLFLFFGIIPMWRRSRLAVLWLLGLPLFTAVITDFTWHHGRYTLPLIPLQMATAAIGIHFLVGKLAERRSIIRGVNRSNSVWIFAVLLVGLFVVGGAWRLPYWATMLGNNTREILDIDVAQGKWLAENTPVDTIIAVDDIGAIGYLSERRILDMNGLISPEVWPALQAEEGLPRNQMLTRILSQAEPDMMAAFPLWRWDIATNPAVSQPLYHVQTDTHSIIFQQDAYIYEMMWPYVKEADPAQKMAVTYGDEIRFLGFDITARNPLELTLYWESQMDISPSYDVFVHLVDEYGQIVAQVDQKPVGGLASTDVWQPGDIIRDPLIVPLPSNLSQGTYELRLGVYSLESGQRLPVNGSTAIDNALILSSIILP